MRRNVLKIIPWLITAAALYIVLKDTDWSLLGANLRGAHLHWLGLAFMFTSASYLIRAYRWEYFFPATKLKFWQAYKVLILGFFMNNILPARTGELVRAHLGAKITGEKRTLVLATIAGERLSDGLMISLFFVAFGLGIGDTAISSRLLLVALFFALAVASLGLLLSKREYLFALTDRWATRLNRKSADYAASRIKVFIDGLMPLWSWRRLPYLTLWTATVWLVELAVYFFVTQAFNQELPLSHCVVFLVTVNFSSLIPAAPGGIGVIEAITTIVLVSLGVPRELALSMVISQHMIQYLAVGLPGFFALGTWKNEVKRYDQDAE